MGEEKIRVTFNHLDTFILVRIERFERIAQTVLIDFIESNNFEAFANYIGGNYSIEGPSMLLLRNYSGKRLREGSIYIILKKTIETLESENRIVEAKDSLIILLEIDLKEIIYEVFAQSVAESKIDSDAFPFLNIDTFYSFHLRSGSKAPSLSVPKGAFSVNVRNVGQGSWNEIYVNNAPKLVYDCGTSYQTKKSQLPKYIGDREIEYQTHGPGLVISHWDVDHYHFIKALTDLTIKSFSFIVCRDYVPTLTSRVIFSKLNRLSAAFISVPPDDRGRTVKGAPLYEFVSIDDQIILFNSGSSKSRNMDGLSILVRTSNRSVLLTGDQHYSQFDKNVLPHYLTYKHEHNIVVPHHGGSAGRFKYNLNSCVRRGKAIISVGNNNYGHPFSANINKLLSNSFKVIETRKYSSDIRINL
jgi:beta-lactamase superfamily II metal-dependent hydrolase